MKIGVTGATGFIGSHLTEELVRRGHEVRCLVRPTSDLRWLRGLPVRLVEAPLPRTEMLGEFVRGLDTLVHAAGSKFAASRRDFVRANETLTSSLLDAVERHAPGLERFIYLSSIAVTGPSPGGRPRTEDEPPLPITAYGESKLRTERLIGARGSRVPFTILRPSGVYGPRDRDILPVFQMARWGVQPIIGRRNTMDLIFVKNLVHAVCLALQAPAAANRVYHVADAHAYTWEGFTRHIHAALGRRALIVTVPNPLLSAAGWVGQRTASWFGGEVKLNDQKVREMKEPYWLVSCERARAELDYRPPYAVEQAVSETLEWYRASHWI
jgi:nucleoside-diphosphate-sugar epimerase